MFIWRRYAVIDTLLMIIFAYVAADDYVYLQTLSGAPLRCHATSLFDTHAIAFAATSFATTITIRCPDMLPCYDARVAAALR